MATSTPDTPAEPVARDTRRPVNRGWYVLLLIPFVALLWLPFYAKPKPELFGFPFFYWYQFMWVFLGSAITGLVYVLTTTSDSPPGPGPGRYDGGRHERVDRP